MIALPVIIVVSILAGFLMSLGAAAVLMVVYEVSRQDVGLGSIARQAHLCRKH